MAKYHVGCGVFSIYAGTLNKDGTQWVNKSDVKDEAMRSVAQYILENDEAMTFNYKGKRYVLCVREYSEETEEQDG